MNRLYAVESMRAPPGSRADHRLPAKPGEIEAIARAVAEAVRAGGAGGPGGERLRPRFDGPPTRQPRWGGGAASEGRGEASASVRAGGEGGAPAPVQESRSGRAGG